MIEVRKTEVFDAWLLGLRDRRAQARIVTRLDRLANGNAGDVKPVGEGVSELRIKYGAGYRLYCKFFGEIVVVMLCGGDKDSQKSDIARALEMAKEIEV